MIEVSTFLMRWLFLSNLVRDVAEIQTLPFQPYYQPTPPPPPTSSANRHRTEEIWRDQCIRGILSYAPGMQRALVMDALRTDLVQQLCTELRRNDDVLRRHRAHELEQQSLLEAGADGSSPATGAEGVGGARNNNNNAMDEDPFLDADVEIVRAFEEAASASSEKVGNKDATLVITDHDSKVENDPSPTAGDDTKATPPPASDSQPQQQEQDRIPPSPQEVKHALSSMKTVREYMPQLVSAVLKSPAPFDPQLSNPIQRLRQLILRRCLEDPSWGVDLCWLLEAEVGRAWKTLFEHRQQTGRRLIVVLPAEKAAVLAKIGTEKREAFDLLQDAEQATAYGYMEAVDETSSSYNNQHHPHGAGASAAGNEWEDEHHVMGASRASRLPSSLSLRRCSHFGDTMHFIDRLTRISSDLRSVPTAHREGYLQESLHEMNRRLRRRMVTRGDVSLDVEDNRSPHDWPQITDVALEHLKHSVHLPLVPQTGTWPSGSEESIAKRHEQKGSSPKVARVLNIVVPESRILASRERCPFLVHVEVADTGLEGRDARLYASGASGLGSTVEEALSMNAAAASASAARRRRESFSDSNHVPYEIPPELLEESRDPNHSAAVHVSSPATTTAGGSQDTHVAPPPYEEIPEPSELAAATVAMETNVGRKKEYPRGGWQGDDNQYYQDPDDTGYVYTDPYDVVRQQQYEQLHEQMQTQQQTQHQYGQQQHYDHHAQQQQPPPQHRPNFPPPISRPTHSVGRDLLNKVFGIPWSQKCTDIRASSPYGHIKGWRLASFILKAGEDIRRESLVMQAISKLQDWFQEEIPEVHRPFMRPYTIMCVGGEAGLVECLSDAKSVDEVKKRTDGFTSLRSYFERAYPPAAALRNLSGHQGKHRISFEKAQDNFLRSLVGYSLICYILQIKDRHNANILLDREGHIMHIDFGFVLGDTPKMGKVPIFSERAPFKLSGEFWEVVGGWNVDNGGLGVKFCKMFELAFACASRHADEFAALVESTMLALNSNPRSARAMANGVRSRLRMRGPPGSTEQKMFIMDIVNVALADWGTTAYDWLQRNMNGYQ